jgi:DNA repair exonuclease SbcCD ATPase subunit
MFTLTRLTVEGFRGFRETEEFCFDQPLTELFGDNASCKSSTTNAIEWALFGGECAGKQTGIRERVGWIVPNQHLSVPAVSVHLEMDGPDGGYVVVRTLRRPPKKAVLEEVLELTLPDGNALTGDDATEHLAGLLQSSFRDFLTTVYQHQEAIRAVLTQEPKDRNDAIDRLLGLSDQRNLLSAMDAADLRGRQKDSGKDFTAFEDQVQAALTARENDLAALRHEAHDAGLPRNKLNAHAALAAAGTIGAALLQFAEEAQLSPPELEVPNEWTGLADYVKMTRKAVSRLRSEVPGIEEQKKLLKSQQQLLAAKTALQNLKQRWADLSAKCRPLDKDHGGRKAVDGKIAEATEKLEAEQEQLRRTNGKAAVINEAVEYLDGLGDEEMPCPVCETVVLGLPEKLREVWAAKLKALVERITVKINALKARLKELRGIAAEYQKLSDDAELLQEEQAGLRERTAQLLRVEIGVDDDPLALIVAELSRLDGRLKELAQAIQERQERLDAIEQQLDQVRLIRDYLHLEKKKQVLETIQASEAFKQLEGIRDQVAQLVEDADAIKTAVAEVARDEAESRLAAAGKTIDEYFRQLSRNPAVQELKLAITADKRTRRNNYEITDQQGKDLAPVLSQGDLNALALSIFLGLAATARETGTFGFLILDDPSQSLGTDHKKQLAKVLDQVTRHKKVIVATMDAEFHEHLQGIVTKAKREYSFGTWTPEEGPTITVQDNLSANDAESNQLLRKSRLERTRR